MRLLDVSHPLCSGMPAVPALPPVAIEPWTSMADGRPFDTSRITMASHSGTHVDAPAHAVPGGRTIDEIPLERFTGPATVCAAHRGGGERITVADLLEGGPTPESGDMLLVATGWDRHYGASRYQEHPSLDPEVADWAVERGVTIVATDTLSPDLPAAHQPRDYDYPVHRRLLGEEVLIMENLRGLGAAVGRRVWVHAFPVAIAGGDAGPARVVIDLRAEATGGAAPHG